MSKEKQKYVLAVMEEILGEAQVRTLLRSAGEDGLPVDILTTLHTEFGQDSDEAMGEFYFAPNANGESQVQYFTSVITLSEEVNKEHLPELYEAISKLNFYLPVGSFAIDEEDSSLAYKHVVPIRVDCSQEELLQQVDILIAHALSISEEYIAILLHVSEGKATVQDIIDLFV